MPGIVASVTVALASRYLSNHYGAPAMLLALLLGIAMGSIAQDTKAAAGINFSARVILRFSVALLGARISYDLMVGIGLEYTALVVIAVVATLLSGLVFARFFGRGWRLGLLTGGSVAICGASAAVAIAAILPANKNAERNLAFTVMSVTILSTLAMIFYPGVAAWLELNDRLSGVFIGATIHDVAQVVGAGLSISPEAGDAATVIKLLRVVMLAPVVLALSIFLRCLKVEGEGTQLAARPPLLPGFVIAFLVLATLASFHLVPQRVVDGASTLSSWGLLTAIAAVGMKTALAELKDIGRTAILLICVETVFLALFVGSGIWLLNQP